MEREIKKFFCKNSTYFAIVLTLAAFCIMSIYLTTTAKSSKNIGTYLGDYKNINELKSDYEQEVAFFEENKEDYEEYGYDLQPIYDVFVIYEFLIDNYMEKDEATMFSTAYLYESRDSLCILLSLNYFSIILMFVVTGLLSIAFFSNDFAEKRHRFIYAGKDRMKIMLSKFGAYMCVVTVVWFIINIISVVFNLAFSEHIPNVIIVSNGVVKCIPIFVVGLIECVGGYIQLLPFIIAFFFVGVLVRNEIVAGLLDIGLFVLVFFVLRMFENKTLDNMGTEPFYNMTMYGTSFGEWFLGYVIELAFVALLSIIAVVNFKKADL